MKRWLSGTILGIFVALATSTSAIAHEDEVHVGDFHIPLVAAWIGGGIVIVIFLLLFISWAVSRRSRRPNDQ